MISTHLSQDLATLHWLAEELGAELEQLTTTPYQEAHRFLARTLSSRLAEIAEEAWTHQVYIPQGNWPNLSAYPGGSGLLLPLACAWKNSEAAPKQEERRSPGHGCQNE